VAVIGGGPAGLAAALALARCGVPTTLVAPAAGPGSDRRTAALFTGSIELLRNLGVWTRLREESEAITAIRIVDDTGALLRAPEVTFTAREAGLKAFGYNVPNAPLVAGLRSAAATELHLRLVESTVARLDIASNAAVLELASGERLTTQLVVAADGRNSLAREAAGIATRRWSYDQAALVCSFAHGRPHHGVSTEFHRRPGPCTCVPLPGNASSLVWVERPEEARRLANLPDDDFRAALEVRMHGLLGRLDAIGPRGVFPLSGLTAATFGANRVALVGEAGHVIPPIGAQGLNLGLRDAAMLAEWVAEAAAADRDPGGADTLASYDTARRGDVTARIWTVDVLNRSLLSNLLPVHLARGAGLFALKAIAPLRRAAISQGLQPSGALPRLMRPGGGGLLAPRRAMPSAATG
jgi:2-octaprenyl-6-methoxyphenol hydroxylase